MAKPDEAVIQDRLQDKILIMGVLNVTPDSFSDGGKFFKFEDALKKADEAILDGADILDVGGESSRPGAQPAPVEEEMKRTVPVIREIVKRHPQIPVSIDTVKAKVAQACLDEGATIVNDISGLRFDPGMGKVVAGRQATIIIMHMQGDPRTMQVDPHYGDVTGEITEFFRERISYAESCGINIAKIWLDPGLGFGKTLEHNLEILRHFHRFLTLGRPLVCGASRKSFIGLLTGNVPPGERLEGTIASSLWAVSQGANVLRVHDVKAMRRALAVWQAIT